MKITFTMTAWQKKRIKDALEEEGIKEDFALFAEPLLASQIFKVRSLDKKQYNKIYKTMEKVFNDSRGVRE